MLGERGVAQPFHRDGMALAAYLAKSGWSVAVLERRTEEGGGLSTEEVTEPNFLHNLHSNYHSLVGLSPAYDDLELLDSVGAKFDLVRPDENGYVFPAGDVDALATILRQILPDPHKRARMGAEARHRMEAWSPREYTDGVVRAVQLAKNNAAL